MVVTPKFTDRSRCSTEAPITFPLAAQIPLEQFTLPSFPPYAYRLRELTLTADIGLDEYYDLLQKHNDAAVCPSPVCLEKEVLINPAGHPEAVRSRRARASVIGDPLCREPGPGPTASSAVALSLADRKKVGHRRRTSASASLSLLYHAPALPGRISSLSLGHFTLGFPAAWLTSIGHALPELRSLTLFGCLLDGVESVARSDAVDFFGGFGAGGAKGRRDLHILDSFAGAGFWTEVAERWWPLNGKAEDEGWDSEPQTPTGDEAATVAHHDPIDCGLQVLEFSYTDHTYNEPSLLAQLGGEELPLLIGPGMVGVSFNLAPPPPLLQPPTVGGLRRPQSPPPHTQPLSQAILPFSADSHASWALKRRFEHLSAGSDLASLKMLNLSLFALKAHEVGEILYSCAPPAPATPMGRGEGRMTDLVVSVVMDGDGWWTQLVQALEHGAEALEALEVIGVPAPDGAAMAGPEGVRHISKLLDVQALKRTCVRLRSFEFNVLRTEGFTVHF